MSETAPAPKIATNTYVERSDLEDFVRPRHQGVLLTYRRDGSPQLSLVTMGLDAQGRVVVSSYPERAKVLNLRRDPRGTVLVMGDEFNDDWVQLDGTAEVVDQPEAIEGLVEYFRVISGEHPDWDEYRAAMRTQAKVLIRITPTRWGPISLGGFPARLVEPKRTGQKETAREPDATN